MKSWVGISNAMSLSDQQARSRLSEIKEWAVRKIQGGSEPPWAWYQYMKLIESIDAIVGGMESVVTTDDSPQLESRSGKVIQLADAKCRRGTAQPHSAQPKLWLPM
jgi:hypothetical protein